MTPEEKARISRENGAKSRGPVSEEGKATSSRNAIKHGEYAETLKHFIPPHEACVCTEERDDYEALVAELLAIYKPVNRSGRLAVGDIAAATWQIERLKKVITCTWNISMATIGARPNDMVPELRDIKILVDATTELLSGNNVLSKLNREVARLQQAVARAERRIRFINKTYPDSPSTRPSQNTPEPTQPVSEPTEANTPLSSDAPAPDAEMPPPIYTTECAPHVIQGYRRDFPGRPIVILPAENDQNDDDDENDYRDLPRKVA